MQLYEDQFSESHDFPRMHEPSKILIIASTPRCGSHMLGHALHETSGFGFPLEYVNPVNLAEWRKRLGIVDLQRVLVEIQRRRTSPNGVFGIKIHYSHIKQFGGFHNLLKVFPEAFYILLSRSDLVMQAVSMSVARQTGAWISGQRPDTNDPEYDFDQINECLRRIIHDNACWRYVLAANGCKNIETSFEDVRNHLAQFVDALASFMKVEIDQSKIPQGQVTVKQGNEMNREWARKFTSEFDPAIELVPNNKTGLFSRIRGKLQ